jgi:hypothetical protein
MTVGAKSKSMIDPNKRTSGIIKATPARAAFSSAMVERLSREVVA